MTRVTRAALCAMLVLALAVSGIHHAFAQTASLDGPDYVEPAPSDTTTSDNTEHVFPEEQAAPQAMTDPADSFTVGDSNALDTTPPEQAAPPAALAIDYKGGVHYGLSDPLPDGNTWTVAYSQPYSHATRDSDIKDLLTNYAAHYCVFVGAKASQGASTFILGAFNTVGNLQQETSRDDETRHEHGAYWYSAWGWSFGFADSSDVRLNSADVNSGASRLSWHMGGAGGYRAGATTGLNGNGVYWKVILVSSIDTCGGVDVTAGVQHGLSDPLPGRHVWTTIYSQPYSHHTTIADIDTSSYGKRCIFVGAKATQGSDTFILGAFNAADNFNKATSGNNVRNEFGAYWYHSGGINGGGGSVGTKGLAPAFRSVLTLALLPGFADSSSVSLNSADTQSGNGRLSWHFGGYGGYRAGSVTGLNSNTVYWKVVLLGPDDMYDCGHSYQHDYDGGVQYGLKESDFADWSVHYSQAYAHATRDSHVKSLVTNFPAGSCVFVGAKATQNDDTFILGAYNNIENLQQETSRSHETRAEFGAYWYSAWGWSFGFADTGSVRLTSADTYSGDSRLSWHMGGAGGYRAGSRTGLNSNNVYWKVILVGSQDCANCPTGYSGFGGNCADINECALGTDNCDALATCSNTLGGFTCTCPSGYIGDGTTCNDANECTGEGDGHDCHADATCTNTVGSYTCACDSGFVDPTGGNDAATAGRTCNGVCPDGYTVSGDGTCVQGFSGLPHDDRRLAHGRALNHVGATWEQARDYCRQTINGDLATVNDATEQGVAASSAAGVGAPVWIGYNDIATEGTFVWSDGSASAFTAWVGGSQPVDATGDDDCTSVSEADGLWSARTCADQLGFLCETGTVRDDCVAGLNPCQNGGVCHNTVSGPTCDCDGTGYGGDVCDQDANECIGEDGGHDCHADAMCTNTVGSFTCACNAGYRGDGKAVCDDIDECAEEIDTCDENYATCTNSIGSYSCACIDGFTSTDAARNCYVITTITPEPYVDGTADNRLRFRVGFGVDVTGVDAVDFHVALSGSPIAATTLTTDSGADDYLLEVELGSALVDSRVEVMLPLAAEGVTPANAEGALTGMDYNPPTPTLVGMGLGASGSFTFNNVITFVLTYPTTAVVTGVDANTVSITSPTADLANIAFAAGASLNVYTWTVTLGSPSGVITATAAESDSLVPAFLGTSYDIEFSGQCTPDECSGNPGDYNVCKHTNELDIVSVCLDFIRLDNSGMMYPDVCPPGAIPCPGVVIPPEEASNVGMCTNCHGTSSGPCKLITDGSSDTASCFDYSDPATFTCPPGSFSCNECQRLEPCVHGTCIDGTDSYECVCEAGWKGDTCEDFDPCTGPNPCVHGSCQSGSGGITCVCDEGYEGDTCADDVDECAAGSPCNSGACSNTDGGYTCNCSGSGYVGDDCTEDINECALGLDNCLSGVHYGKCVNTDGSFTCGCETGYYGDGLTSCSNVDECAVNTHNCDALATCADTEGSFTCTCPSGYHGDGTTCTDDNECNGEGSGHDCDADATCTNTDGGFTCACNSGFSGDGNTCSDVDECANNPCATGYTCSNTIGSYSCDDVDECAAGTDSCDADATCTNTVGSYTCACNSGYIGDGTTCNDANECNGEGDGHDCDADATCTNTAGGFTCACNAGYTGDGNTCVDDNECTDGSATCGAHQTCTNTPGSYTCPCDSGWASDGLGGCVDVDECTQGGHNCDANAACSNTDGGFTCTCNAGYEGDGTSCSDIDDCAEVVCLHGGTCVDELQGFHCDCPAGASGGVCEHHVCGHCAGVAPCMHENDGECIEYLPGSQVCPVGTIRCDGQVNNNVVAASSGDAAGVTAGADGQQGFAGQEAGDSAGASAGAGAGASGSGVASMGVALVAVGAVAAVALVVAGVVLARRASRTSRVVSIQQGEPVVTPVSPSAAAEASRMPSPTRISQNAWK